MAIALAFTFCGKKEQGRAAKSLRDLAKSAVESYQPEAKSAAQDYTQPYLTDERMKNFIASMKEEHNPFEMVFKEGGQMRSLSDLRERMEEYNEFARKYGFKDYEDYITVWGRITVGEIMLFAEESQKSTVKSFEDSIKNAEEELKKPDIAPEMKKMYEEQISSYKESLEEMKSGKEQESLNAADLELVKKYKAEIEAASQKYKQKIP